MTSFVLILVHLAGVDQKMCLCVRVRNKPTVFKTKLVQKIKGKLVGDRSLDARPSDAIVIALRMDAPILVDDAVMKEVGVLDEDIVKDVKEVSHSIQKHLEEQLVKAVEVEDYERAAVIRDKIKELSI